MLRGSSGLHILDGLGIFSSFILNFFQKCKIYDRLRKA